MNAKADLFEDLVRPLAASGNEFATLALLRVMLSDDPDAEVDGVCAETLASVRRALEVLQPVLDAWNEWNLRSPRDAS